MDYYKDTLESLHFLLESCDEKHWSNWIARSIDEWEYEKGVAHYKSALGGMGSFNDLVICVENGHNLSKEQEPWANELLTELGNLVYHLIILRQQNTIPTMDKIKRELKRRKCKQISGVRCLSCGYAVLTQRDVDHYIAPEIVMDSIIDGLENRRLLENVEKCLTLKLETLHISRGRIKEMICRSNDINFVEGADHYNYFMRPCDKCESDDTAIYRWNELTKKRLLKEKEGFFKPSWDNLSLRRKI